MAASAPNSVSRVHVVLALAAAAALRAAVLRAEECPRACACEPRPWFTPRSSCREALTVDCNDARLLRAPRGLPAATQVLLLQSNGLASLGAELRPLLDLSELDLSQNELGSVRDAGLANHSRLVSLHLEENALTELADGCLRELAGLQELYVNHNRIGSVAPGAFAGLANLMRLHLNANELRSVDSRWFEATPNLEILMIGENPVAGLSDMNFMPLSRLLSLVLAGMGLRSIPENALMGLDNLESLSFYNNSLAWVPSRALQKVPNLKFLDLNKNPIQVIRAGDFRDMSHIKELCINSMLELVSIDGGAFENLPELARLEVTNNPRLSFVHPEAFGVLPALETLMLNDNGLSALHRRALERLRGLREVGLHGNPLRCDCITRWMSGERPPPARFVEPWGMRCASPAEHAGRRVRDVGPTEFADSCLPAIPGGVLPADVLVGAGSAVALHCRALAEPEASVYWVTPGGERVAREDDEDGGGGGGGGGGAWRRYRLSDEGTLEILDARFEEAGLYTCVARNSEGLDTKAVMVKVDGSRPAQASGGADLTLDVTAVGSRSARLTWRAGHGVAGSSCDLRWWSAPPPPSPPQPDSSARPEGPRVSFSARVPVGVREYNLTHLWPSTAYEACLSALGAHRQTLRRCVNLTTAPAEVPAAKAPAPVKRHRALALAVGGALASMCLLGLLTCGALKVRKTHAERRMDVKAWPSVHRRLRAPRPTPLWDTRLPLMDAESGDGESERRRSREDAAVAVDTSRSHSWLQRS
ncbi:unnamed protein product [Lampetra planeri]